MKGRNLPAAARRPGALAACLLVALGWAAFPARAAEPEPPAPGWVTLPLADYLALVERVDEQERSRRQDREEPVAELTSQRTDVVVEDDLVRLETTFQVELRGTPTRPVPLPLSGLGSGATIEPGRGAALDRDAGGRLRLVAPEPGSYTVTVRGRRRLEEAAGVFRLPLAATDAPVAVTEVDLPADLAWSAPGAVVAEDREEGQRRRLRLALPRGRDNALELRRRTTGAEEEKVLARAVPVTLLEVLPEGLRRHDVVLYEVLRGELGSLQVELPAGLDVEVAATDEGEVLPRVEAGRLTVQRHRRLTGVGYLAVTSRPALPAAGAALPLAPVVPSVPVRARYLVAATRVAASLEPRPAAAWTRVDEEDLPAPLRRQLGAFEAGAVWRRTDAEGPVEMALDVLPAVAAADGVVRRRESTTLLTVDGSLLFRDRLVVEAGRTALDLTLPDGALLWSASVDGLPVRPVERAGRLTVPLAFKDRGESVVEVVAVAAAAVPPGRSRIRVALPRVGPRVLEHSWRLLLPQGNRYRYAGGDLQPAPLPSPPVVAVLESRESLLLDEREVKKLERERREEEQARAAERAQAQALEELSQGLVGGVKPLAVTIPETGKLLLLAGALPPPSVAVELEVKARR